MIDLLRERGAGHIKVFGGGGGVIVPAEIARAARLRRGAHLLARGRPAAGPAGDDQRDRRRLRRRPRRRRCPAAPTALTDGDRARARRARWRGSSPALEAGTVPARLRDALLAAAKATPTPALGITGTGGAGKSSLTDELVRRFRLDQGDRLRIAIVSIDPSRRKSGGALLGDRIRMNAIGHPNIFMRSLATRDAGTEVSRGAARRDRRLQGRGLRPRHRRDLGHRPGRRRDRAARRRLAVRDDAGVRRRLAAREDRHARLRRLRRDQQVRPQGRRRRAARRAQAVPAQPRALSTSAATRCRCSAPSRRASTTTASPRSTRRSPRALAEQRPQARAGHGCARVAARHSTGQHAIVPARARALPRRDRREPCAATTRWARRAGARRRASASSSRAAQGDARGRRRRCGRADRRAALDAARSPTREAKLDPRARKLLDMWPQTQGGATAATSTW